MRRLIVFNNLSLDGFFADMNSDISWVFTRARSSLHLPRRLRRPGARSCSAGRPMSYGRLLAETCRGQERSGHGRTHECFAEGRVLSNAGQSFVEQYGTGKGRSAGRRAEDNCPLGTDEGRAWVDKSLSATIPGCNRAEDRRDNSPAFLLTWTCSWASGYCSNETPG